VTLILTPEDFKALGLPPPTEEVDVELTHIVDLPEQHDIIMYVDATDVNNPIEIYLKS